MKKFFSLFKLIIKPFRIQALADFEPPKVESLSDGSDKTKFYLNDPSSPNLMGEQVPPANTCFPMNVRDDKGPGYPLGSVEQQASACKIVINNLLSYLLIVYKLTSSEKKLDNWCSKRALTIFPRAGEDLNAYYDRNSLKFFYYKSPKKVVYACETTPVVCHEFGHAFLDTIRPDFWSSQSLEVWAYHESFGDISSIISSLQSDEMINEAIRETNGDMLKSNVITKIGAEMGRTYYDILNNKNGNKNGVPQDCLRDASVVYKYVKPETLPKEGRDDVLVYESHNFSRVFTGAFYEICIKLAHKVLNDGICKDLPQSVKFSRDICTRYLLKATVSVPLTSKLFEALAKHMLLADKNEGSKYQEVIKQVFLERNIISDGIMMLDSKTLSDVKRDLKEAYTLESFDSEKVIKTMSRTTIKILDKRVLGLNNNHLYGLQIEVPNQVSYYFDENDKLFDVVGASEDEVINTAMECLDYLDKNNLIGSSKDSLFEIKYGKIVRKQIKCKCGSPNYCDPNAPEFNKPWKPANNSSCCGKCVGANCQPRSCDCSESSNNIPKKKSYCKSTLISCFKNTYTVGQFISRKVCSN